MRSFKANSISPLGYSRENRSSAKPILRKIIGGKSSSKYHPSENPLVSSSLLERELQKWQRTCLGRISSLAQLKEISRDKKVVIYDTEFTSWEGAMARNWTGPGEHPEIFQIGAVRLDLNDNSLPPENFNIIIKPKINKILSDYSQKLCGISQAEIETHGVQLEEALIHLYTITEGGRLPLLSYGQDAEIILRNAKLYGIFLPLFKGGFYDIRPLFKSIGIDTNKYSSGTLYKAFSLPLQISTHNAIDDSLSLAASLVRAVELQSGTQILSSAFNP